MTDLPVIIIFFLLPGPAQLFVFFCLGSARSVLVDAPLLRPPTFQPIKYIENVRICDGGYCGDGGVGLQKQYTDLDKK